MSDSATIKFITGTSYHLSTSQKLSNIAINNDDWCN